VATSELPAHAHIGADERATLHKEASEALAWLQDKLALQSQLAKHDEPVLTTADIQKKAAVVDRACRPIATKPVPAPKPAPKPEAAAAAAEGAAAEGASAEGGEEEPMEAEGAAAEGEAAPMDEA